MTPGQKKMLDEIDADRATRKGLKARVADALTKKGIKISTGACGCCDGVSFSLEIDGETICEDETDWNFSNFAQKQ